MDELAQMVSDTNHRHNEQNRKGRIVLGESCEPDLAAPRPLLSPGVPSC